MLANRNSSLYFPCPLCNCGERSLRPHVAQVALATNAWGVVRADPTRHGVLVDNQANDWTANKCCYTGKRHGEEKLPMWECAQAKEGKYSMRPACHTFGIILIFSIRCTMACTSTISEGNGGDEVVSQLGVMGVHWGAIPPR